MFAMRYQEKRVNGEWFKLCDEHIAWLCSLSRLDPEPG